MPKVAYEPISAKDALKQIKDLCSIIVDLAYSALIYEDRGLAEEIKELRDLVVNLDYLLKMSLQVAVRDGKDAQATLPLLVLGEASTDIANSATDIANVILKGFTVHPSIKELSQKVARDLMRGEISDESILKGYTISDIIQKMNYSITIYAIRKDGKWKIIPDKKSILESGDIILASGSMSGISLLKLLVGGTAEEIAPPEEDDEDLESEILTDSIVDYLIALKDTSEVMVDLSYGAVLYNNKELAQLVSNMEKRVDTIRNKAEIAILRLAKTSNDDLPSLQGLIRIVEATENISDDANQIAKIVLAELPSHPIIELVIGESTESIFEKLVENSSLIVGKTVPAGNYLDDFGIRVLAIKRAGGHYFKPRRRTKIRAGDTIIFTGLRDACNAFQMREEEAVEEKEAEIEATKKAAEKVVNDVVSKVTEEVTDKTAKEVSLKTAQGVATKAAERAHAKVVSKAASDATSEATEVASKEMTDKIVTKIVKDTIKTAKAEHQELKDVYLQAVKEVVEAAAKKTIEGSKKKVEQMAKEAVEDKLVEKSNSVIKKASDAATKKAADEVEIIVKDAVKMDTERAAKRAATEAIKETASVDEPEKMVKDAATEAAIEVAEKAAEKAVERSGKKAASKIAEETALEVTEQEIKKAATKAAKEVVEEVFEKEVKEAVQKAAEEAAAEQATKKE
ncbi:MAG TPA: TrkA C-terminal domain-containing protein [Candidatus Bathyarchaeia archaeon]|nr:TrkA C-terminal domain-containing protein [Candidatus Bathyarchaeia archaeon]